MLFNSFEFIFVFLPITLFLFFQIAKYGNHQLAQLFLTFASLLFYAWWDAKYLVLIIASMLFNYFIGVCLQKQSLYNKIPLSKKGILIIGIVINLGILAYFKYTDFVIGFSNSFLRTNFNLQYIILPLAISFFTFTQIAYIVDAYKQKAREYSFLTYCLFVTFFPHLIAGPIIHHHELIPQFESKSIYIPNYEDISIGITIFALGLFKKVLFADTVAIYANTVFNSVSQGDNPTFLYAWIGAIAYSLQLYFDFSGYSDMAIGVARMFGIKFPINFNSPYKSISIVEFWRRWHITLSNFLRDYLYIPLGGSRKGTINRHINLLITMLLGGLWHGAGWNFIIWGALHGIYLVINHTWNSFLKVTKHSFLKTHWFIQSVAWLITTLAIIVGWVFFRSQDVITAVSMLQGMVMVNGIALTKQLLPKIQFLQSWGININLVIDFSTNDILLIFACFFILITIAIYAPNTEEILRKFNPSINTQNIEKSYYGNNFLSQYIEWKPNYFTGFVIGILIFISFKTMLSAPASEFLYFNF